MKIKEKIVQSLKRLTPCPNKKNDQALINQGRDQAYSDIVSRSGIEKTKLEQLKNKADFQLHYFEKLNLHDIKTKQPILSKIRDLVIAVSFIALTVILIIFPASKSMYCFIHKDLQANEKNKVVASKVDSLLLEIQDGCSDHLVYHSNERSEFKDDFKKLKQTTSDLKKGLKESERLLLLSNVFVISLGVIASLIALLGFFTYSARKRAN